MPVVQADTLVGGRTPDQVWPIVKDSLLVASRARHVVTARPRPQREKGFRVSEWTVLLNGSEVSWVQRETAWPGPRLRFEQTSGDLEALSGTWSLAPVANGTRIFLHIDFELGVDSLAPLLEPIWSQSLRAHADALLEALTACTA
jgi:hypothetical protein